MWPLLETVFLTANYHSHGWNTCLSLKSTTPDMEPICNSMFGFLPTYRQLIKPRESVSLFDELLADSHTEKGVPERHWPLKFGVCDIRDDLASRNFMETKWKKGRTGGLGYYVGESKQRVIFDLVALVNKGSGLQGGWK